MYRSIKKYARVYYQFLATCFSEATSYRLHFFLLILMDLLFYISTLGSVHFIFDHVDMIGPWQRDQFMFFLSFMLAIDQLHMTLVSESFWQFSYQIRTGALDFVLLKPVVSTFSVFFRHIRPASILLAPVAWGLVIYYGQRVDLSVWSWLVMPMLLVLGFALILSIEVLLSMSMFWVVESFGINFLRLQLQNIARWPDFIFRFMARKLFTVFIPVLLVGNIPVKVMLGGLSPLYLIEMVVAICILSVLIRILWRKGLRSYESASS